MLSQTMKTTRHKVVGLDEAVRLVPVGPATVSLGGNSLHRVPHAFVRRLAQLHSGPLHVAKTAAAYDVDLLCLAGVVSAVSAGFVGYETEFGLARHYRTAVESGAVEAREHACYTLITAFRASAYGLPSLPVNALQGSDLIDARGFLPFEDPYSGERFPLIPAIRPDVAVIHVQYADSDGNGVIIGPKNEDTLIARAAKSVVLTTERVVAREELPVGTDHIDIPSVLVDAVVQLSNGAWPGSCYGEYEVDPAGVQALQRLETAAQLQAYLREVS